MRRLLLLLMSLLAAVGVWQAVHQLRVCERLAYTAGVNLGWHIYTTALLDYALYTAPVPFIRIHEDGSWWHSPAADAIDDMRSDLVRFERDIRRYGFPTPVGVNRCHGRKNPSTNRFPHTCGGEPFAFCV